MRIAILGALSLALASGCGLLSPAPGNEPPKDLVWETDPAPFRNEKKVEIPAEAKALLHFSKGQMLLAQGEFNQALPEFEAAVAADPTNAFLRHRLATLLLRKGDFKGALKEAEEAARLAPQWTEKIGRAHV